ncbi:MAG: hypothetical protein ABSG89_10495 [Bacteroidales bacterium]|jgi:hypothetical protein
MKKKLSGIEISELFMVKAGTDLNRTFIGKIYREKTKEGKQIIHGYVKVNDGNIYSSAETQEELGKNLDEICLMKLNEGLHSQCGSTTIVSGIDFYLN